MAARRKSPLRVVEAALSELGLEPDFVGGMLLTRVAGWRLRTCVHGDEMLAFDAVWPRAYRDTIRPGVLEVLDEFHRSSLGVRASLIEAPLDDKAPAGRDFRVAADLQVPLPAPVPAPWVLELLRLVRASLGDLSDRLLAVESALRSSTLSEPSPLFEVALDALLVGLFGHPGTDLLPEGRVLVDVDAAWAQYEAGDISHNEVASSLARLVAEKVGEETGDIDRSWPMVLARARLRRVPVQHRRETGETFSLVLRLLTS